jgi:hypothetical protein
MNKLKRSLHYEYWPLWIFYIPVGIYGLILALKARSITYFTTVNPCMRYSGSLENAKSDYLKYLPQDIMPITTIIDKNIAQEDLKEIIKKKNFNFPIVIKPDSGQRGIEIEKIIDFENLTNFLKNASRPQFLIQEFIDYPIELGILIAKNPTKQDRKITSVTLKKFLNVKGNGSSTLKELICDNLRASKQKKELEVKFANRWNEVIPKEEDILLEPIGNHSRGTEFIDGNYLINNQLLDVIDNIVSNIPHFYYGRIDLKVKSLESLMNGENIKVLEINGVNSEPAHIYDKNYNIINAYKDLFHHMELIYDIGYENRVRGEKMTPFKEILKGIYQLYNH